MLPRKVLFRLAIVAALFSLGVAISSPIVSTQAVAGPGQCKKRC
jgi:hypothetical protein